MDREIPVGGNSAGAWVVGSRTGQNCPVCGCDCWSVRYVEQPGGVVCLCTCAVCLRRDRTDGRAAPQIVVTEYPGEAYRLTLPPEGPE